jgi:hypothetical protein
MIGNLAPSGNYNWADVDALGGLPVVMKELSKHGMIHEDCLTVTGKTVGENLADVPDIPSANSQDVLFPVSNPWSEKGNHISILKGSLAPDGAVIKLSGKDIRTFKGPAKVFNSELETFYGADKRLFWEPLLYKNDHFTKTCSGQTRGEVVRKRRRRFLQASRTTRSVRATASSAATKDRKAPPACRKCSR